MTDLTEDFIVQKLTTAPTAYFVAESRRKQTS